MTSRATGRGSTPRGGRPNKGKRQPLLSRVPEDLAVIVTDGAESAGLTTSDYIALVLAEKHGYELPAHHYPRPEDSVQEAIPMHAAS